MASSKPTAARRILNVGAGHGDDLLIGTPEIAEAMARLLKTGDVGSETIVLPSL